MRGWLVVNGFTRTQKFLELYAWIEEAARARDVELTRLSTLEVAPLLARGTLGAPKPDFVIFWDKDVRLCHALELAGCLCLNSAHAIATCDDKARTYLELLRAGIPQPATVLTPKTFHAQVWGSTEFPRKVADALGLPVVVKECFGSFGAQVHLAHDAEAIATLLDGMESRPSLCQEFVRTSAGHDVRLQVVGDRVVAAMERVSTSGDFRANVTNGATAHPWQPTPEQMDVALLTCEALGLDFAGVDLLFGPDDKPIVCEVNSNAHFVNLYHATGINVANYLIDHAVRRASGA